MNIEQMEKSFEHNINEMFEANNKEALARKDRLFIELIAKDENKVLKIKSLSMQDIYRCFKKSGYSGGIRDLTKDLDEFGIRPKREIEWLKDKNNFKKCSICGGDVMSLARYVIDFKNRQSDNYKDNLIELVNRHIEHQKIISQVKDILKDYGLHKFHICHDCSKIYKINKNKGKNVYEHDEEGQKTFSDKMQVILDRLDEILPKFGLEKTLGSLNFEDIFDKK